MDSLLASYASSDDDEESPPTATATATATAPPPPPVSKLLSSSLPPSRLFSSLPPPKSYPPLADASKPSPSSLFSALPPPKSNRPSPIAPIATADDASKPSPSLFSSLPPPKPSPAPSLFSSLPSPKPSPLSSSLPPPKSANPPSIPPTKTVVKFTPPVPAPLPNPDSDSDDETRKRKSNKSSVAAAGGVGPRKSSSLFLPAPKNTLCLAPALGGGAAPRRSTLQADTDTQSPDLANSAAAAVPDPMGFVPEAVTGYEDYGGYDGSLVGGLQPVVSGGEGSGWVPSYGAVGDWSEGPVVTTAPDLADMERAAGKRARRGIPMEIVEVKQDELMKNRPREDQHKATGVAFGPAYQAVSSSKGKPSKLHKRKHQIGSLYFDMKSKEAELAERRSRGFLTKAETQAKYGW